MALNFPNKIVTANGVIDFGSNSTQTYSYKIDGTFGGGNVEVGYLSASGSFVRYDVITAATVPAQGVVTCGGGSSVAFKVSGATAPSIAISVNVV